MWVLGAWAAGNILAGAVGSSQTSGQTKYFHQMNMGWGIINLSLAGVGLYGALHGNNALSLSASLQAQGKLEKIFLFNAALDIAYITGGFYLQERSRRAVNPDRLKGFGKSIVLQGAFLLLFDAAMYGIHHHQGSALHKLVDQMQLSATPQGIGVTVRL